MKKQILFIISSLLILTVIMAFELKEDQINEQEPILEVQNIGVDIENPARFYFYREKGYFKNGDVLSINCREQPSTDIKDKALRKVLGKGKFSDLKIVLIHLNTGVEFVIPSAKFGETFAFGSKALKEGNYSIEFTGTKKLIRLSIKLNRTLNRAKTKEEKNSAYDMIHVESMFIGEGPAAEPRFTLPLVKGDQISVSTSSKRVIKFQVAQTGKTHPVPAGPIAMAEDGNKRLHFYLDEEKDKNGFFIFGKGDRRYIDLIIRKIPFVKPEEGGSSGTSAGGENGNGSSSETGLTGEDDPSNEGLTPAEIMAKNQAEFNKQLLDRMDSMNRKRFVIKPEYVSGFSDEPPFKVAAKLDLGGKYRTCEPLRLQKSAYWTFWLGVGDEADELYKKREVKALERSDYQSLLENYAAFVIANPNAKADMPLFQSLNGDLRRIGEYVEYAIVNANNKNLFEAGENYSPFMPQWEGLNTISDYGSSTYPSENLYLCLCNHNKMSPVNVYFKYEMYEKVTEEQ